MKVHAVNFGDVVQEGVVGDIGGWRRRWRGCGGVLVLEGGHDRPNWERPQPRGPGTHGKLKKLKWKVYFPTHLWNWKVLSHKELHRFCWKSGEKRHFEICFMLIAYARPDKHQSYQKIIDKDITGLPQKKSWHFGISCYEIFWKHFHSHSQISLVIHQNQQRSKLWPSWITPLGVFKDFQ